MLVMPGSHAASVRAVEVNGAPAALARAGDAVEVRHKPRPGLLCMQQAPSVQLLKPGWSCSGANPLIWSEDAGEACR